MSEISDINILYLLGLLQITADIPDLKPTLDATNVYYTQIKTFINGAFTKIKDDSDKKKQLFDALICLLLKSENAAFVMKILDGELKSAFIEYIKKGGEEGPDISTLDGSIKENLKNLLDDTAKMPYHLYYVKPLEGSKPKPPAPALPTSAPPETAAASAAAAAAAQPGGDKKIKKYSRNNRILKKTEKKTKKKAYKS